MFPDRLSGPRVYHCTFLFFQRHLNKETYTEVGECVITCRITHNVSEASSEDGVGGRAGGWTGGAAAAH